MLLCISLFWKRRDDNSAPFPAQSPSGIDLEYRQSSPQHPRSAKYREPNHRETHYGTYRFSVGAWAYGVAAVSGMKNVERSVRVRFARRPSSSATACGIVAYYSLVY